MVFNEYGKLYDDIYKDKDYVKESEDIEKIIRMFLFTNERQLKMLDLGCGTGTHAKLFTEQGFDVTGVDFSKEMIDIAKKKNPGGKFLVDNIANFKSEEKFDVAVALFHVVSYLTDYTDISNFFQNVYNNTTDAMLLIFDVWCGNGVLTDPPSKRMKHLNENMVRLADPTVDHTRQTVDVRYIIKNEGKKDIEETHTMRYFFATEIAAYLGLAGFEIMSLEPKKVKRDTWNLQFVCKKWKK